MVKNLIQICLVVTIQFIACYLAKWNMPETGFILVFVMLWQGLFILLFHLINKKHKYLAEFKFSKFFWYIFMPLCSLISPLLSLMVFIAGTLNDLRSISGCISIKEWIKAQVVYEKNQGEMYREIYENSFDRMNSNVEMSVVNIYSATDTCTNLCENNICYSNDCFSYINNEQSSHEHHHIDINPTTGLPMIDGIGSVDVSGNVYGSGRYE